MVCVCVCVCVCVLFFCFYPKQIWIPVTTASSRYMYMNLVGFTAHPCQKYPELPLPPLKEKDGVLKAIFLNKVGA